MHPKRSRVAGGGMDALRRVWMRRTMRRRLRDAVSIPNGPQRRTAITTRAVVTLAGVLLIGEAAVSVRFSGTMGLLMMVSTAGLGAFVFRGIRAFGPNAMHSAGENPLTDSETGLPTRQMLIDNLA